MVVGAIVVSIHYNLELRRMGLETPDEPKDKAVLHWIPTVVLTSVAIGMFSIGSRGPVWLVLPVIGISLRQILFYLDTVRTALRNLETGQARLRCRRHLWILHSQQVRPESSNLRITALDWTRMCQFHRKSHKS